MLSPGFHVEPSLQFKRRIAGIAASALVGLLFSGECTAANWTLRETRDEIADTTDKTAMAVFPIDRGGRLEVSASCNSGGLYFDLAYQNEALNKDGGPALLWNGDADDPRVLVRTRLDQGDIVTAISRTDHRNLATVFFYDAEGLWFLFHNLVDGAAPRPSPLGESEKARKDLAKIFGQAELATFPLLIEYGAGSVDAFNSADVFKAEVPLSDGHRAIATIERKDPIFQAFLKSCRAKGLAALDYDRNRPRPTCVAGEKLRVKEGAVARKPDSVEAYGLEFEGDELVTVQKPTAGIPSTFCRVAVPTLNGGTVVASVSRAHLQTQAEWDADHQADIDKTRNLTIDAFEPTLRQLMAKYSQGLGIDPSRYEQDIAEVTRIARICADIKQSAVRQNYTGKTTLDLTPDQQICRKLAVPVANRLGRPVGAEPRSLVVWPSPWKLQDRRGGMVLTVTVAPGKGDDHRGDDFHRFGILKAEFPTRP